MTLRRFFYHLAIIYSWYTAWRSRNRPLHTARFARLHDLTPLMTAKLDGTHILLAKKPFFNGLSNRLLAVKPTTTQRELGHTLLVGKTRSGKGLAIETNLLTFPHSVIVNDIKKELWHRTAGFRQKGLGGKAYLFDPQGNGARFDPLEGKRTDSELRSAATTLLYRPHEKENAIFIERAITMLVAIFHASVLEGERLLPFTYRILNEGLYAVATILEIVSVKHNAYPNLATKFLDTGIHLKRDTL